MEIQKDIQRERLFYIDYLAYFTGQVTRKDLVTRFGISEPAATKDLSLYADLAPGMLEYDVRQRRYAYAGGHPYFEHSVDQALFALAGGGALALDPEHGKRIPSWVHYSIKRKVSLQLVAKITRAICQHRKIEASYFSTTSGDTKRVLSPLALVNDGLRWHIRCYDHTKHFDFGDFVLGRFMEVSEAEDSEIRITQDEGWTGAVTLKLAPHPKSRHPESIRIDYDIEGASKEVTLRTCLVGYFLHQWPVDTTYHGTEDPAKKHLFLTNREDLEALGVPKWCFEQEKVFNGSESIAHQ